MDFFQSVSANPNATSETLEKKRIGYWTGLKLPKEMIEARVAARKGIAVSAETCAKISAANKGRVLVKDSSLISKALKGVSKSQEHRKNIDEINDGRNKKSRL